MGAKPLELKGKRFGTLLVLRRHGSDNHKKRTWFCRCDCGRTTISLGTNLVKPFRPTRSCRLCSYTRGGIKHRQHGGSGTTEYVIWKNMRQRCTNPRTPAFEYYGGRGIEICKRWNKFENFLADMGPRPAGLSIERKNNSGNYEPSNCIWADKKTQAMNRRPRKRLSPSLP